MVLEVKCAADECAMSGGYTIETGVSHGSRKKSDKGEWDMARENAKSLVFCEEDNQPIADPRDAVTHL